MLPLEDPIEDRLPGESALDLAAFKEESLLNEGERRDTDGSKS